MRKRITVGLPSDLLDRGRRRASAEGRSLNALIEEGLRSVVTENKKQKKRVLPRVSTAAGGPMPGFETITLSKIQALDDLEYAERMKRLK